MIENKQKNAFIFSIFSVFFNSISLKAKYKFIECQIQIMYDNVHINIFILLIFIVFFSHFH